MCNEILNLPCSTSPAVHRSVLDLQNFSNKNNTDTIDHQEGDREVVSPMKGNRNNKTRTAPAQKNNKSTKIVKS